MDPATIAISLNVLSNFLYDLLKRAKGSSGLSPVDAAIAREPSVDVHEIARG